MEDVLCGPQVERPLPLSILLDDVATQDDDLAQNLEDGADTVLRLTAAGAMVGLPKCQFGVQEARHLGHWWTSGGYFRPPAGKLAALMELSEEQLTRLPRAKIYGMLGFWRDYVPDFAARTSRLRALLSRDAAPWTAAHTEELRRTVQALVEGAPMINFNPAEPVVLESHTGPKGLAAVFLQRDPQEKRWLPVATYGRELLMLERQESPAVLELTVVQEALKKLVAIATGAKELRIHVSADVAEVFRMKLHLAPGLVWRVCDIMSYCPLIVPRPATGEYAVAWDPANDWSAEEVEQPIDVGLL